MKTNLSIKSVVGKSAVSAVLLSQLIGSSLFAKTATKCASPSLKSFNAYGINSAKDVYAQLNNIFKFPNYFGNNKDALFDYLTTDFNQSYVIVCENTDLVSSKQAAGIYEVLSVIEEAQQEYGVCVQLDKDSCGVIKNKAGFVTGKNKQACIQDCIAAYDKPGAALKACVSKCQ